MAGSITTNNKSSYSVNFFFLNAEPCKPLIISTKLLLIMIRTTSLRLFAASAESIPHGIQIEGMEPIRAGSYSILAATIQIKAATSAFTLGALDHIKTLQCKQRHDKRLSINTQQWLWEDALFQCYLSHTAWKVNHDKIAKSIAATGSHKTLQCKQRHDKWLSINTPTRTISAPPLDGTPPPWRSSVCRGAPGGYKFGPHLWWGHPPWE